MPKGGHSSRRNHERIASSREFPGTGGILLGDFSHRTEHYRDLQQASGFLQGKRPIKGPEVPRNSQGTGEIVMFGRVDVTTFAHIGS